MLQGVLYASSKSSFHSVLDTEPQYAQLKRKEGGREGREREGGREAKEEKGRRQGERRKRENLHFQPLMQRCGLEFG